MQIERRFTTRSGGAYGAVAFTALSCGNSDPDAGDEPCLDGIEMPRSWTQDAADALVRAGLCTGGVAAVLRPVPEMGVPECLWRRVPDDAALAGLPDAVCFAGETSARQVFDRLVGAWAYKGWKEGYFSKEEDASAYVDEMRFMLARQMAVPGTEQWASVGLHWAYGWQGAEASRTGMGREDEGAMIRSGRAGSLRAAPVSGSLRDGVPDGGKAGGPVATLNLMTFQVAGRFDSVGFCHAVRLWTVTLDIAVTMGSSVRADTGDGRAPRAIRLGHANLGGLLMAMGLAYDSDAGRAVCGAVSAIMTATAFATSAEMAAGLGGYVGRADARRGAMRRHCGPDHGVDATGNGAPGVAGRPDADLMVVARAEWDRAQRLGQAHGFRNASVTALPADADCGRFMACGTAGTGPHAALIGFAPQGNGDYVKEIAPSVPAGLAVLGYARDQIDAILAYVVGHGRFQAAPAINPATLAPHGFGAPQITRIEAALSTATDLRFVVNRWTLGADFCTRTLRIPSARLADPGFDLLCHLGFSPAQIDAASRHICGTMMLEGAPHLRAEHLAVFDCANPCGVAGQRRVSVDSQTRMMAAAQRFLPRGIDDFMAAEAPSPSVGTSGHALSQQATDHDAVALTAPATPRRAWRDKGRPLSSRGAYDAVRTSDPATDDPVYGRRTPPVTASVDALPERASLRLLKQICLAGGLPMCPTPHLMIAPSMWAWDTGGAGPAIRVAARGHGVGGACTVCGRHGAGGDGPCPICGTGH